MKQLDLFEKKGKKLPFGSNKYLGPIDVEWERARWQEYYRHKYHDYHTYEIDSDVEVFVCACGIHLEITYRKLPRDDLKYDPSRPMYMNVADYRCPRCTRLYYMRDVEIISVFSNYENLRGKGLNGST